MMKKLWTLPMSFVILTCVALSSTLAADSLSRPNVLFIAIDDLNHWVSHLGVHAQTKTPHIDRLAASGVSFSKAYCAAPACNPSRIALMSGKKPSTTGCYDNSQDWRPTISQDLLLNHTLMKSGYNAFGAGKIFHGSYGHGNRWTDYLGSREREGKLNLHPSAKNDGVGGIKFAPLGNTDQDMPDWRTVDYGLEQLGKKHDQPFFLAVGLVKPHMPFSVPKKWFDQFPLESIQLPPHTNGDLEDVPEIGKKMAGRDHAQILESGRWKEAVQAYLATIAFCDSQVGRLIEGLENSIHRDNTIVCLWSDHGWSLGEKEHWRKFALWEEPTRTVFIWKVPGVTPVGKVCGRPVDYMSIYPTICALTGITKPSHVEGLDITPLLKDPNAQWDLPALTTFHKDNHSFRSEQWRYIRYADGGEELYDHRADPNEWTNLASDPKYAEIKTSFAKYLPSVNAPELPSVRNPDSAKSEATGNQDSRKKARKQGKKKGVAKS